jgi:murein DD-endopeptidase MepM/ murein hydrolase activator NlpD
LLLLNACRADGPVRKAPVVHYGESQGAGSAGVHSVKKGDTLWDIARAYDLSMRAIIDANDLNPPYNLAIGQRIELPPPQTYRVQDGDTLYRISRIFDTNTTALARLNNLSRPYILHEGDRLTIPGGARNAPDPARQTASAAAKKETATPPDKPGGNRRAQPDDAGKPAPARSSGRFLRPVEGRVISSYGPKKNGQHNDGINIHAPAGAPVRAAANGRVVYAGDELEGYGNLVLVRHEDRWMSAYAHLDDVLVKRGETVRRGQSLATVGSSGSVSTPQLHFELRRGTNAVDPAHHLGQAS